MRVGNAVTISQNYEFRRAYGKGKCFAGPALVSYCFKTKRGRIRIGITAAKKVGGAVQRNRCRRVIREAYRSLSGQVQGSWDIVFVARSQTIAYKSTQIAAIMEKQLRKAGVIV